MSNGSRDESVSEIYLQISPNILESFPRFRPPVDLYRFDERVRQIKKFHKAEARLGTDKQEQVAEDAQNGTLYLLRDDYRVYARHLSRNLGLVLVEEDLQPQEVAEIFFLALRDRLEILFEQPKEGPLKGLKKDLIILAEYIWIDPGRVEFLTKTLHKEYSLAVHSVNSMFIGLGLYTLLTKGKVEKSTLVTLGLGLALHDLGMANVPRFIVEKEQYLIRTDRASIENHIEAGTQKLKRLNVSDPLVMECLHQHHERLDGSGYPERRMGKGVSMAGKICGLADSFSAMIADRPHRDGKAYADAALILAKDHKKYDATLSKMLAIMILKGGAIKSSPEDGLSDEEG